MPKSKKLQEFSTPVGSPPPGEPLFLAVGKLLSPHGLKGEILVEIMTDFPERLKIGATIHLGDEHQPVQIISRRNHKNGLLLGLDGITSPEAAKALCGKFLFVKANEIPSLPEGDYYHHQILGLKVISDKGQKLGYVSGILETGANDVLIIRNESGKELLLPHISSVVLSINLNQGEMIVHLLPGITPETK